VFPSFQNADLFPISGVDICLNIVVALICGLCIAWLYRHTYKGPRRDRTEKSLAGP